MGDSTRMAPRLILASGSPRRRELLEDAGYIFEVVSPAVVEASNNWLTLREITVLNATRKAAAVARTYCDATILAADTLVAIRGEIIGKPDNVAHAAEILRQLSGRAHEVCSAVSIWSAGWWRASFHVVSRVQFRALSAQQIADYIAKVNPLDKAGAYAAQGYGAEIIERIEGSYTNVVGLPMEETMRTLAALAIYPKGNQSVAATSVSRARYGSRPLSRRNTR